MQTVTADGSATLLVRGDGRHRVYAFLQPSGSRRQWSVKGIEPAAIEVKIGRGPGVFDVSLPHEAIARTLDEIAAKATKK